jgi:hypothetical protein
MPSHYCLAFLFKELQMNAKLNKLVIAVKAHINSDADLGKALTEAKPIIDAMPNEERIVWFHTNIGTLVAKAYACKLVTTRNGTTSFERKDGTRHDTALSKFRYVTQLVVEKAPSKTTRTSLDPVSQLVTKYEKLSKVERRRFLTQIGQ